MLVNNDKSCRCSLDLKGMSTQLESRSARSAAIANYWIRPADNQMPRSNPTE
jgi:hypothetical protein